MADLGFKEDASAAKELGFVETKHGANMTLKPEERERRRLKSESADRSGPIRTEGINVGDRLFGLAPEEVGRYHAMSPSEQENFRRARDDAGKQFIAEIAGQTIGSAIVPVAEGVAAPIGRKIVSSVSGAARKAAPNTTEFVRKAIEHSQAEAGKLAAARAVGSDVAALAGKAAGPVSAATKATATGVGAGVGDAIGQPSTAESIDEVDFTKLPEPVGPQSSLHNAVDRLRAQAGNNPRAADPLARMQASKNTPTGTVTQSTGVA